MATRGHHECEIFVGRQPEGAESEQNWRSCQKNPGHSKFIPAQSFIDSYLPRIENSSQQKKLKARIDLTVRLRMRYTSLFRPADDGNFSHCRGTDNLRTGTGFIVDVAGPVCNKPCPCRKCAGKVKGKYYTFCVQTALHVVYNTEEAKATRVDLFYDDANSQRDGKMKSVWAMEVLESVHDRDRCKMVCVTCDGILGERIKSAKSSLYDGNITSQDLADLDLLPSHDRDCIPTLIVSHPHAQPKQITVGDLTHKDEDTPIREYTTPTCPGSSGAPVFVVDRAVVRAFRNIWWTHASVHSGSYFEISAEHNKDPPNILNKFLRKLMEPKASTEQINYGHGWWA